MADEKIFHVIMKELCEELGINIEKKSFGWILQLSKGEKTKYVIGTTFPLNPESSGAVVSDKFAAYEIMDAAGIPTIKHMILFNPHTRSTYVPDEGNYLSVVSNFLKYGSLVVKPNSGCAGHGVALCKTLKDTEHAIEKLFKSHGSISLCPYYDIEKEYRTFFLDGKVLLIYGKTKPYVIGNGISTLEELVLKLNLPEKSIVKENLSFLDMEMIPHQGEVIELSWKHNLSGGATATLLEKGELYKEIEKLSIQAGKALDMRFATIDIIRTKDNQLYVMEVNSSVGATIFTETVEGGYELTKGVYREALKAMFDE